MASVRSCNEDFLFEDDFDAILGMLEESEEFEDYLDVAVEEVSIKML